MDLHQHPLSAAFPGMQEREFEELINDIKEHGQLEPIVIFEDMVLDGWHRYRACLELDRKPTCVPLSQDQDPVAYVQSKNLHRRHLTGSQRAEAVVACSKWAPAHRPEKGEAASPFSTTAQMAKAAEVSERTIEKAKRAHEAGLGDAVRDGKVTAERAAEIAKLPEPERQAALEAPRAPRMKTKSPRPGSTPNPQPHEPDSNPASEPGAPGADPTSVPPSPAPKHPAEPQGDDEDLDALKARIKQLEDENAELKEHVQELLKFNDEAKAENNDAKAEIETMRKILDAEDLLAAFDAEVKCSQALSRSVQSQNRVLMVENYDLSKLLTAAQRKIKRMEGKGTQTVAPEPHPEEETYNAVFPEEATE